MIALASRDAVRVAVKFLFEKKGVEWDEKSTPLELIHSRMVEEFVAVPEQVAALDFVRMPGSNAEHGVHVKKTQSARAEKTARDFAALVGAAFEPGRGSGKGLAVENFQVILLELLLSAKEDGYVGTPRMVLE